jgi:hypothetical protein
MTQMLQARFLAATNAALTLRFVSGRLMEENFVVTCPYCGEDVDVHLERDVQGSLVQDCEVCCSPWLLRVEGDDDERTVTVTRADGSE